jgi:hypothetical protein
MKPEFRRSGNNIYFRFSKQSPWMYYGTVPGLSALKQVKK